MTTQPTDQLGTQITAAPGTQEVVISRVLNAPREIVFRAYTDPVLLARWLGPREYELIVERFEPWSGGSYRYFNVDANGNRYAFSGVCHDVSAPERIIQTFEFEGLPERGHVSLDTALFEALPDGRTRVTTKSVFQSVADRDAMIASGMEWGVRESYERLSELLPELLAQ